MNEPHDTLRFEQVVLPHLDAAYNLARWLTGNAHDADDVTQEACMRALRFFGTFRGGDARTWLLRIVRNTFYSLWRQGKRRETPLEFDEDLHSLPGDGAGPLPFAQADLDPESLARRAEDMRLLDRALGEIPDEFREVLVLREIEDLSYKQVAEALEIPMGTVMSRISRARRMLAAAFERLSRGAPEYPKVALRRV